jgi:hypothetical protein
MGQELEEAVSLAGYQWYDTTEQIRPQKVVQILVLD